MTKKTLFQKRINSILAGCFVVMMLGCNSSPYELADVSGKVLVDGKPLDGGFVNFQPISDGESKVVGPGSTAKCDAEGRFTLKTIHEDEGAVVGTHRVRIYSFSPETAPVSDSDPSGTKTDPIPDKYNYQSKLKFVVPSEGTDQADFEISTKDK